MVLSNASNIGATIAKETKIPRPYTMPRKKPIHKKRPVSRCAESASMRFCRCWTALIRSVSFGTREPAMAYLDCFEEDFFFLSDAFCCSSKNDIIACNTWSAIPIGFMMTFSTSFVTASMRRNTFRKSTTINKTWYKTITSSSATVIWRYAKTSEVVSTVSIR